jgi:hypothetical protein
MPLATEEQMDVSETPVTASTSLPSSKMTDKKIQLLYNKMLRLDSQLNPSMETSSHDDDKIPCKIDYDQNISIKYEIQTLAVTIQSLCSKNNFDMLFKVFEFCMNKGDLFTEMCADLFENSLLKNFDLFGDERLHGLFEKHFDHLIIEIIRNQCSNKSFFKNYADFKGDQIFFRIFSKMGEINREKLIKQIIEKTISEMKFLKIDSIGNSKLDIRALYLNLAKNKLNIYKLRDILLVYKKFIPEHGLFLIDSFLNLEKHLYANLTQQSVTYSNFNNEILNIERRSLNLMRRLCVIEFIPEFLNLLDKLDNRHCYRWIEKSLEFFTKYSIFSTNVNSESNEQEFKLDYTDFDMLNVSKS